MEEKATINWDINDEEKKGFVNEFLWICSGANRHILRKCPADYAKYAGIGGTTIRNRKAHGD